MSAKASGRVQPRKGRSFQNVAQGPRKTAT